MDSLPDEIILQLCQQMSLVDLISFQATCHRFYSIVTSSETLWSQVLDQTALWSWKWLDGNAFEKTLKITSFKQIALLINHQFIPPTDVTLTSTATYLSFFRSYFTKRLLFRVPKKFAFFGSGLEIPKTSIIATSILSPFNGGSSDYLKATSGTVSGIDGIGGGLQYEFNEGEALLNFCVIYSNSKKIRQLGHDEDNLLAHSDDVIKKAVIGVHALVYVIPACPSDRPINSPELRNMLMATSKRVKLLVLLVGNEDGSSVLDVARELGEVVISHYDQSDDTCPSRAWRIYQIDVVDNLGDNFKAALQWAL